VHRRVAFSNTLAVQQRLTKEIRIWAALNHKNILPLLGYLTEGDNMMPSLISEWMGYGSLNDFMKSFPRGGVETCRMLADIASGLAYLHSKNVIHADLKSYNILISPTKAPLLADFGLSLALSESQITTGTTTSSSRGTVRWMAIELFPSVSGDEPERHNEMTDIWSFGMIAYELLSWSVPYKDMPNDLLVMMAIVNGELPVIPKADEGTDTFFFDKCCDLARSCWHKDAGSRPTAEELSQDLSHFEASKPIQQMEQQMYVPSQPGLDEEDFPPLPRATTWQEETGSSSDHAHNPPLSHECEVVHRLYPPPSGSVRNSHPCRAKFISGSDTFTFTCKPDSCKIGTVELSAYSTSNMYRSSSFQSTK